MKYINLSSLVRNQNENDDILSLSAKKGFALDFTVVNTPGTLNNYSISEESSFKFTAATNITGFSGGFNGKLLYIYNGNNSSTLNLNHNSLLSLSQNRIVTNTRQDLQIPVDGGVILQYDSDSSFWRIIGGSGGSESVGLTHKVVSSPLGSLKLGMPVYWNGTNYAPANAITTTKIPTAIVKEINVNDYTVQFGGILTLTNLEWDELTDDTGGLSDGSGVNTYYLSDSIDGGITNVSPVFSIPVLNCIKNTGISSTVEIKFGTLSSTLLNESYSTEREVFISNGSSLIYTLNLTPHSRNTTHVTINGITQQNNSFSISNKNIVFSEAPPLNIEIEVNYLVQKNFSYANITKYNETPISNTNSFNLPVAPSSENEIMTWIDGELQDGSNFSLDGNLITFNSVVSGGQKFQSIVFSSVQFSDFPYIKRKTTTINSAQSKTLINIFGNQATGSYYFNLINNPLISGTIRLQESNPIVVRVETFSTDISITKDTVDKINIYINNDGNLEIQNRLGSTANIMIERHQ